MVSMGGETGFLKDMGPGRCPYAQHTMELVGVKEGVKLQGGKEIRVDLAGVPGRGGG